MLLDKMLKLRGYELLAAFLFEVWKSKTPPPKWRDPFVQYPQHWPGIIWRKVYARYEVLAATHDLPALTDYHLFNEPSSQSGWPGSRYLGLVFTDRSADIQIVHVESDADILASILLYKRLVDAGVVKPS